MQGLDDWIEHTNRLEASCLEMVKRLEAHPGVSVIRPATLEVGCIPFILRMIDTGSIVTIRLVMHDILYGDDVVLITNMTTLPEMSRSRGLGSTAVGHLLSWARGISIKRIRATQISNRDSERFWEKNGFSKLPEPNPYNDFIIDIEHAKETHDDNQDPAE